MRVHEIFFRFAGLLPIGAGSAKRNDGPQCPPQANFFWDLGGVLYKNTSPHRVSARRRRNFFEHLGGVVHKNHVAGMHSGTCFWRKTPPKSSKISASGGANPQMFENPPVEKSGITRGVSRGGRGSRRYRLITTRTRTGSV